MTAKARLAIDIGGTFTDVALEVAGSDLVTTKVLTTSAAPERGVLEAIDLAMKGLAVAPEDIGLAIHGTTLATNLIIERKGAVTALIVTAGHRDALEMAHENRFEQYDINVDRPTPLVPRHLRLPVTERVDKDGKVLLPLNEGDVRALIPALERHRVESVAIGLIHGYANPAHERRIAEILRKGRPGLSITLASEVCPEIREYERLSTACANAYVQPLMASYLGSLEIRLRAEGYHCPLLMMTSGGGMVDTATAARFPIRLVESGPAGGAILASHIARAYGRDQVVSFDMGGTTAKLCLIDGGEPLYARDFEVDRSYRFKKGSGLPVRIPVIEMVEIGAGGGSIASVDQLARIRVGPESAGSEPGPAAYARGGARATVTDADVVLGRVDVTRFAGGSIGLEPDRAAAAIREDVGVPLDLDVQQAAFGISEIVDENMTNAARTHAVERGKEVRSRLMIAFGGAAPLHAARLADKLGLEEVLIPKGAGVGSAIGFLLAPIAYEVVRSRYMRLSRFDAGLVSTVFSEMQREARAVVRQGAPDRELTEKRQAFMRYVGQGHEVAVDLPELDARGSESDAGELREVFDRAYESLYGRTIPGLDVEILSWTLSVATERQPPEPLPLEPESISPPPPLRTARVFDAPAGNHLEANVYQREALRPGTTVEGPALVVEDQTTTVVPSTFRAAVTARGDLMLTRRSRE